MPGATGAGCTRPSTGAAEKARRVGSLEPGCQDGPMLTNRVTELLGVEIPIVQAPMGCNTPQLSRKNWVRQEAYCRSPGWRAELRRQQQK